MCRIFLIVTMLCALAACGNAPQTQSTTVPILAVADITPTLPSATIAVTSPTPSITKSLTVAPITPTPTKTAIEDDVQRGYMTLIFVKASAVMAEETAIQLQAGELKGLETFGRIIGISTILQAADEALKKDAPTSVLENGWTEARLAVPMVQDVLKRWTKKEITSADIAQALQPAQAQIDKALVAVENDLAVAYDTDTTKLREFREQAIEDLRTTLHATPTPKP